MGFLFSLCFALLSLILPAAQADQYKDCESCVENGWGWSWSKNQCGGYLNTNCDPDSAEALDEEEDEDFSTPAPTQNQQQQQAHASQAHDAHVDDDVSAFLFRQFSSSAFDALRCILLRACNC